MNENDIFDDLFSPLVLLSSSSKKKQVWAGSDCSRSATSNIIDGKLGIIEFWSTIHLYAPEITRRQHLFPFSVSLATRHDIE